MVSSIELEGDEEAITSLDDMANSLTASLRDALTEAAQTFIDSAQGNAPVDTGFMRDNIEITDESDTSITVTSQAGYSGFVEYGTRNMDSQPFFEPAIQQSIAQIQQIISDAISPDRV